MTYINNKNGEDSSIFRACKQTDKDFCLEENDCSWNEDAAGGLQDPKCKVESFPLHFVVFLIVMVLFFFPPLNMFDGRAFTIVKVVKLAILAISIYFYSWPDAIARSVGVKYINLTDGPGVPAIFVTISIVLFMLLVITKVQKTEK
tara:strand:+ start:266 stop:703 length:438 start_codon:yes stop_codon:yes gene_type:complete